MIPLERRSWWLRDGRLVPRYFVAEQTPTFRQRLYDELEMGARVGMHLLTARRFPNPDNVVTQPGPDPRPSEQAKLFEPNRKCWTCEQPDKLCVCPPPRSTETVRVRSEYV